MVAESIQRCALEGGRFAIGMSRGSGKSALCEAGCEWVILHGHHFYAALIGATEPMAVSMLASIQLDLETNDLLAEDFPEVCYPIRRLEGIHHRANGQHIDGARTRMQWTANRAILPTVAGSISSGSMISVAGLTSGNIRGLKHKLADGRIVRPSFVIVDDPQTDESANSITQCLTRTSLLNGAVMNISGPGQPLSLLMPMTVIRQGDVADVLLDRDRHPDWRGVRLPMVKAWPEGITNTTIDELTPAGKAWATYRRLSDKSYRKHQDFRLATKWYKRNRALMDTGFDVSWAERFDERSEISAQQHAMNIRFRNASAFLAEYQLVGTVPAEELGRPSISGDMLAKRIVPSLVRAELPIDCQHVVAFVDVQDEALFWLVLGADPTFSGAIVDYGTFPAVNSLAFTKQHLQSWGLLSRLFFDAHPGALQNAERRADGSPIAPRGAKLYYALSQFVPALLKRSFTRQDPQRSIKHIARLGIDIRWGEANATVKRWILDSGIKTIVPCAGQAFPPTNKQLEDYQPTKGWLFEHQRHPTARESRWVVRPSPDGTYYMQTDVNRLKDFAFQRLSTPMGSPGAIALFADSPERHALFAGHVCESEYPEPVTARGYTKNLWQPRKGKPDNDWLDCLVGCLALASLDGACTQAGGMGQRTEKPKGKRKIADKWRKEQ